MSFANAFVPSLQLSKRPLPSSPLPITPIRPLVPLNTLLEHLNTIPFPINIRNIIPPLLIDATRVLEVFVQVINEFQDVALERGRDGDVVNEGEVNNVFAEANTAGVGTDGDTKSGDRRKTVNDIVVKKRGL
jgi:hypothetical protein